VRWGTGSGEWRHRVRIARGRGAPAVRPAALAVALAVAAVVLPPAARAAVPVTDYSGYVNPFVGTAAGAADHQTGGGAGNTFPGPVLPGGMIRLGPDTLPSSLNASGGYAYADHQIRGFSLLRMSGAGCTNFRDVPITPTTAAVTASPVAPGAADVGAPFVSAFDHRHEQAGPGYYQVALTQPSGDIIGSELTSSVRSAVARFTFPATRSATVLVNAAGSAGSGGNDQAAVRIDPARREISGSETSGGFCDTTDRYRLNFTVVFNHRFRAYGTWKRQSLSPGATAASDALPAYGGPLQKPFSAQAGGYLTFDTTSIRTVEARVAISFVSVDGARRNLAQEIGGRSFDAVRSAARRAWDRVLGRVDVSGAPAPAVRRFYTALYQALIEPGTFDDVDGRYPGMDGLVHRARGYTQYADFSGWDVYRTQMPLLAMVEPSVAADVAQSLLADARQSGWLPRWSVAAGQTNVMTGDPAAAAIASIYAFGARGFDASGALQAMVKGGTRTGRSANDGYVERPGLDPYLRLGYVPQELNGNIQETALDDLAGALDANVRAVPVSPARTRQVPVPAAADTAYGSAGTTLEYNAADFATSRLARALGDAGACRAFLVRSGSWRTLYNRAAGYIEPRLASGMFIPGYNPYSNDVAASQGFAEGDAAQYTWMVPFDPAGLFAAMGGRAVAARRLDVFFTRLNEGFSSPYAFMGNEPNSNAPWLYDWAGQPFKTQALVRRILVQLYTDDPGGFPGNDDLGQMSAWYVMSALGLYPAVPGTDVLALGAPQFAHVVLHLARGDVVLDAPGAPAAPYVGGLTVNGTASSRPWLSFSRIAGGAALRFRMATAPVPAWGAAPADAPPSFPPAGAASCATTS
jgi:predicted alpha-1,2-mannosidase